MRQFLCSKFIAQSFLPIQLILTLILNFLFNIGKRTQVCGERMAPNQTSDTNFSWEGHGKIFLVTPITSFLEADTSKGKSRP